MKSIKIPLIEGMAGMGLGQVVSEMETRGAKGYIDSLNWPVDFPYAPLAAFGTARSEEHTFISYFVRGLDL